MWDEGDMDLFVQLCERRPAMLHEVSAGLSSWNEELAGDCAELMRHVAERASRLVVPFEDRFHLITMHEDERVRREIERTLAIISRGA
jgi:hypothetical protein